MTFMRVVKENSVNLQLSQNSSNVPKNIRHVLNMCLMGPIQNGNGHASSLTRRSEFMFRKFTNHGTKVRCVNYHLIMCNFMEQKMFFKSFPKHPWQIRLQNWSNSSS